MTTDRRSFLKYTGAALLATQLPDIGKAAVPKTTWVNPHGTSLHDYRLRCNYRYVKPGCYIAPMRVARRHVMFVQEGVTPLIEQKLFGKSNKVPIPPVGTLVSSPDGKFLFTVVSPKPVGEVITYVTGAWDAYYHGKEPGQNCEGVVMEVEAFIFDPEYHSCNIRKVITPGLGYNNICEAWYSKRFYQDENDPITYLAVDAVYPLGTTPDPWGSW